MCPQFLHTTVIYSEQVLARSRPRSITISFPVTDTGFLPAPERSISINASAQVICRARKISHLDIYVTHQEKFHPVEEILGLQGIRDISIHALLAYNLGNLSKHLKTVAVPVCQQLYGADNEGIQDTNQRRIRTCVPGNSMLFSVRKYHNGFELLRPICSKCTVDSQLLRKIVNKRLADAGIRWRCMRQSDGRKCHTKHISSQFVRF